MGLKVGVFTDSYKPYTSGVVRSVDTLKQELTKMGHEVYIFAPCYYGNSQKEESGVFRFISIPAPTNPEFSLAIPYSLTINDTIKKLQLDIIHVHSPFLLGRLGAYYAKMHNIPLVFTFHTFYEQYVHYVPFGEKMTRNIVKKFCSEFGNNCNTVIAPSIAAQKYLQGIGVRVPIKVIPTGIPVENFEQNDQLWLRKKYNISQESIILLFVGRLGKEKNVGFILDVFNKYIVKKTDATLVVAGGGPEESALKRVAEQLNIAHKVIFTGNLSKHEIISCYYGADIFVFASVTETQGLVISEAKAAGLPVVAINKNGASEMIENGHDGFLTDLTPQCFANRIMDLIDNYTLRHKMGANAKESAELISSYNCALRMVYCYLSLMDRTRPGECGRDNKTKQGPDCCKGTMWSVKSQ